MRIHFSFILLLSVFFTCIDSIVAQSVGNATYYSNRLHGRRTSDGSLYHRDSLTCAHKTLPLGSLLKVRNPKNGAEVVVKVTDRGPYRRGAIVDLSYAAAKKIGILQSGVARVEVERYSGEDIKIPYRSTDDPGFNFQLVDPKSGMYYSLSDWNKKNNVGRRIVRKMERSMAANSLKVKSDSVPRWRVLHGQMTASVPESKNAK